MSTPKVCVDIPRNNELLHLYDALLESKDNILHEHAKSIVKPDTQAEQLLLDSRKTKDFEKLLFASHKTGLLLIELAVERRTWWGPGKRLRVRFLEGDFYVQQKVQRYAKVWEQCADIRFDFIQAGDAEIRISFQPVGSWSQVGTDALSIRDQSEPTMNFGWFDRDTLEEDFRATTLHEFGHALGCIHEHQTADAAIKWNKQAVYDYYWQTQRPPWDKAKVDHNVFRKFTQAEISNNNFDPRSIMLYPIPAEHTLDGFSVGWNTQLSKQDMQLIAINYPMT